ncbi:hypothetical protein ACFQDF_09015 [Ectobacillus funiculus]
MEPNVTATNVEVAKPSLWGVITSPSLQFERMKQRAPIGLPMLLMAVLYAIIGALSAYLLHQVRRLQDRCRQICRRRHNFLPLRHSLRLWVALVLSLVFRYYF